MPSGTDFSGIVLENKLETELNLPRIHRACQTPKAPLSTPVFGRLKFGWLRMLNASLKLEVNPLGNREIPVNRKVQIEQPRTD